MGSAHGEPRLEELCTDLLLFMIEVQRGAGQLPREEPVLRRRLHAALGDFASRARDAGYSRAEIDEARYALAAAVDETLQFSSWPARQAWSVYPLQVELFNDRDAGVGFFARLAEIER